MSGWRTAWRNLTRAIRSPASGLLQKPAPICVHKTGKADLIDHHREVRELLADESSTVAFVNVRLFHVVGMGTELLGRFFEFR
jgi:hypothetical protein